MSKTLDASYAYCRRIARREAANFYYAFLPLPAEKRRAMVALYAFLRHADDLSDSSHPVEKHPVDWRCAALTNLRASLDRALSGQFDSPLFPALADTMARYQIPPEYLYTAIDGVASDLEPRRFESFDQLADYCYQVAGVVGLTCILVWGYRSDEAPPLAIRCGRAFQLTNILRDLKEDTRHGRLYLPLEDLRRFEYTEEDLRGQVRNQRFRALMHFEIARTEVLYQEGARLQALLEPDARAVFGAMLETYRGILEEIKRRDGDVFSRRVELSRGRKLRIVARQLIGQPRLWWPRRKASNPP